MLRVQITTKGLTPSQFRKKLFFLTEAIDADIAIMGDDSKNLVRDVISAHRKRGPSKSGDRLAKSITSEMIKTSFLTSVGIGNKNYMDSKAPYWRVVNDGGLVPTPAVGFFGDWEPPRSELRGRGNQPFTKSAGAMGGSSFGGGFNMTPKTPIRPMNFIETSINTLSGKWAPFWSINFGRIWKSLPTPMLTVRQ